MDNLKERAIWLDQTDPLASYRQEFYLQDQVIYLDGNSLGLLSTRAETAVWDVMKMWKNYGIDGWNEGKHPWFYLSEKLGSMMAPLLGAKSEEVIVTGSTTINLHQLLSTFYQPTAGKNKILADELNFPSDLYAISSHLQLRGYNDSNRKLVKSNDGLTIDEEVIISQMKDDVALVILPSVLYRSGQLLNMQRLTEEAHQRGIIIGFDLAHSIGAIPHSLSNWDVDFAFWCNYKYLNGGPGAVAGLYVNERHFDRYPGLFGWFSSNKQLQFDLAITMNKGDGAGAYQIGTPHVLSVAPLIGSLSIYEEIGIERIREKSLKQTQFFIDLVNENLLHYEFSFGNPIQYNKRGGHISLIHQDALRIAKALKSQRVIPDFRPPNLIRMAPSPLYTSYEDIWMAVQRLQTIMNTKEYEAFSPIREVIS